MCAACIQCQCVDTSRGKFEEAFLKGTDSLKYSIFVKKNFSSNPDGIFLHVTYHIPSLLTLVSRVDTQKKCI